MLSYSLCQLQAVQDPEFLLLHFIWTHLSQQLCREQHQVLHEEPHCPSGCCWDLGQSAHIQAEVDVFGAGQIRSSFLDPSQRSGQRTKHLISFNISVFRNGFAAVEHVNAEDFVCFILYFYGKTTFSFQTETEWTNHASIQGTLPTCQKRFSALRSS